MKLGKLPPDTKTPRLMLEMYFDAGLPPLPTTPFTWTLGQTDWGMLGNDEHGDCVLAGVGHSIQVATLNTWGPVKMTDEEVLGYYTAWAGWNPADPSTDRGANIVDILTRWKTDGFGMAGHPMHRLFAFADVDHTNIENVMHAIHLLGPVAIGVQLPTAVQGKDVWDTVYSRFQPSTWPGSWGGHDVTLTGFDASAKTIEFISWGKVMTMTLDFFSTYVDEVHAQLLNGWQYRPGSIDMKGLQADLAALTS